jgi:uncharacterized protein YyaL (SSP411 family)
MVRAYLSLFEATGTVHYLNKAERMTKAAIEFFWDREKKGFFFTPHDHEKLFFRVKEATDGAIPSGNAIFAHNFLKLYAITTKDHYRKMAVDLMKDLGTIVKHEPVAAVSWLAAYHFWWGGNQQLILVSPREDREIFRQIQRRYLPNKVLVWLEPKRLPESLAVHAGKKMLNGLPTLYICQNFSCREPLSDPVRIHARLDSLQ